MSFSWNLALPKDTPDSEEVNGRMVTEEQKGEDTLFILWERNQFSAGGWIDVKSTYDEEKAERFLAGDDGD